MFGVRCLRRCTSLAPSPNPVEETRRKGFSFSHHESASSDGHRTVTSDPVSRAFQILTDHDNLRPLHSEDVPERSLNGNDRCGVTSYFLASPLSRCRAGCHCLSGSLTSVLLVQSLAYLCIVCSRATAMCVCGVCARQMAVRRPTTAAR